MARLVLVPSPFVGAASWRPLLRHLPDAVVGGYGGVRGPDWYDGVAHRLGAQVGDEPWIAVLHSGAGGFAPALAAAHPALAGLIFVDATMPYPGRSWTSTASKAEVRNLQRLTTDGLLAPWNAWFEPDPTVQLIPDAPTREAFVADLPRVPFAFLEAVAPLRSEWERLPSAFVQLSCYYGDTANKAEERGWPVRRARMHHLAMLSHPAEVAGLLTGIPLAGESS